MIFKTKKIINSFFFIQINLSWAKNISKSTKIHFLQTQIVQKLACFLRIKYKSVQKLYRSNYTFLTFKTTECTFLLFSTNVHFITRILVFCMILICKKCYFAFLDTFLDQKFQISSERKNLYFLGFKCQRRTILTILLNLYCVLQKHTKNWKILFFIKFYHAKKPQF